MKRLLLLAASMSSCESPPTVSVNLYRDKPYLIVESAELSRLGDEYGKYRYFIGTKPSHLVIYLDEKLSIGDTLWIGKK